MLPHSGEANENCHGLKATTARALELLGEWARLIKSHCIAFLSSYLALEIWFSGADWKVRRLEIFLLICNLNLDKKLQSRKLWNESLQALCHCRTDPFPKGLSNWINSISLDFICFLMLPFSRSTGFWELRVTRKPCSYEETFADSKPQPTMA